MNSGLRPFALGLRPLSRCQTPQLCAGPFLTWAPAPPFVGSGPSKWSKFAEKGFGTVVVHGDLTSVKLFEVLLDISVSCTKTPTRKYPLETHVEMGSEFAVEEKCMKWTKFAEKGVEPANAHGDVRTFGATIKWFQYHTEDQGRYAVEIWYGDGDYQVKMNLKEAANALCENQWIR
ncbi:hypothetical protein AOL_s00079g213 [Orbilia oligospora ATCC 24927]|uniref:Uncharacterized protein n=1 Tax=Arthrobotrys oligospora (strain ATCC 24927 / CBS 115.81 / DSM 1491) TaxID=756982 RepID=G1XDB0_ARTOA|nr:hypothetical protein AOL_s00079g213 [Orbilia oligospora ATCC 24927]EGX48992.1 hypothetical protein AOL_s00079g213 [Orbilia oligospora ATCC 24927]